MSFFMGFCHFKLLENSKQEYSLLVTGVDNSVPQYVCSLKKQQQQQQQTFSPATKLLTLAYVDHL